MSNLHSNQVVYCGGFMFSSDFRECFSLLRMLETKLNQPYKSFDISIMNNKGRIQFNGEVPFSTVWQGPLELAVTINSMLAVLEFENNFINKTTPSLTFTPDQCGNGVHSNPHKDCFLR